MFGYVTELRSMSQGRATSTMEFFEYKEVPRNVLEKIKEERLERASIKLLHCFIATLLRYEEKFISLRNNVSI